MPKDERRNSGTHDVLTGARLVASLSTAFMAGAYEAKLTEMKRKLEHAKLVTHPSPHLFLAVYQTESYSHTF